MRNYSLFGLLFILIAIFSCKPDEYVLEIKQQLSREFVNFDSTAIVIKQVNIETNQFVIAYNTFYSDSSKILIFNTTSGLKLLNRIIITKGNCKVLKADIKNVLGDNNQLLVEISEVEGNSYEGRFLIIYNKPFDVAFRNVLELNTFEATSGWSETDGRKGGINNNLTDLQISYEKGKVIGKGLLDGKENNTIEFTWNKEKEIFEKAGNQTLNEEDLYEKASQLESYITSAVEDTSKVQEIKNNCAILLFPTDDHLKELEKKYGQEAFAAIADDNTYYIGNVMKYLDSLKIDNFIVKKRYIKLIKADNSVTFMDMKGQYSRDWNIVFFNTSRQPKIIDYVMITPDSILNYFK